MQNRLRLAGLSLGLARSESWEAALSWCHSLPGLLRVAAACGDTHVEKIAVSESLALSALSAFLAHTAAAIQDGGAEDP